MESSESIHSNLPILSIHSTPLVVRLANSPTTQAKLTLSPFAGQGL
jgi:hypothetical protein